MKIAIIGAGSLGCVFGAMLTTAGHDVWLIHRRREHVDKINRDGLHVEGLSGDRYVRVKATTDPAEVGPVDLALVLVKAMDTRAAVANAVSLAGPETVFLTLQNGLGNREKIAEVVGEDRAMAGITGVGGELVGLGHVVHTVAGTTYVGELDGSVSPRAELIARALDRAGIPTEVTANVQGRIWDKVLRNSAANATCAITGYTPDYLFAFPSSREWVELVARETATVAAALGVKLPYDDPLAWLRKLWGTAPDPTSPAAHKPSMVQDIEKGRPTEVEAINGAVVRAGESVGVPTPYNRALTLLVHMIEAKQQYDSSRPGRSSS